jgi:hypothetical protein
MKKLAAIVLFALCAACSNMKVAEIDPTTGHFKTSAHAKTTISKAIDLDPMKALLLIPDQDFVRGQIKNIGYFENLITFKDLETEIVKNNLQDKIPDVSGRIGLNKAYKEYKPFLWFRYDTRGAGNDQYGQFILTDPGTLEDIFVAEIKLDYVWAGVNDQTTWYPLFNELIEYIKANSKTYKK